MPTASPVTAPITIAALMLMGRRRGRTTGDPSLGTGPSVWLCRSVPSIRETPDLKPIGAADIHGAAGSFETT